MKTPTGSRKNSLTMGDEDRRRRVSATTLWFHTSLKYQRNSRQVFFKPKDTLRQTLVHPKDLAHGICLNMNSNLQEHMACFPTDSHQDWFTSDCVYAEHKTDSSEGNPLFWSRKRKWICKLWVAVPSEPSCAARCELMLRSTLSRLHGANSTPALTQTNNQNTFKMKSCKKSRTRKA